MKIKTPMNLDEVKELQVVPDGKYICKVKNVEPVKASTGNDMLKWHFVIIEGDYTGQAPFFYNTVLVEQALFNLKQVLEAIDVEWDEDGFNTEECIGKECIIQGKITMYQGKERNEVVAVLPVD